LEVLLGSDDFAVFDGGSQIFDAGSQMREIRRVIESIADTDVTVLLLALLPLQVREAFIYII